MDTSTSSSPTIAGLPVPSKEIATRWIAHGGVAALGVAAVLVFMPYVNQALNLLLNGFLTLTQMLLIAAGTLFGGFLLINLWGPYKRLVESFANKATWAIFEYDPITPMELWLQEINKDKDSLEEQFQQVGAVIAQNEQTVNDNLTQASKADKKFAAAVQQYGQDSQQAQLMSLEPGTLRETAQRIQESTKPLYVIRDTLKEIVDATAFTQRKAELDVEGFKKEYAAGNAVSGAVTAANRVLRTKSERKQNALSSMQIIHDKYAGSLGRLQSLKQLSQDVITSVDVEKGTYHQEALDRLRNESRAITGGGKPTVIPALVTSTPVGVPATGGSFYSVPKASKSKGNSTTTTPSN